MEDQTVDDSTASDTSATTNASTTDNTSSTTLTDEHHDWASNFCGIDTRASSDNGDASAGASATTDAAPTGSDQGSGTVTIPEVTIIGDPSQANADSSSDGTSTLGVALPVMAAAAVGGSVTGTSAGPGGMPPGPEAVDANPFLGGSTTGTGSTAGSGADATAGGTVGGDAPATSGIAAGDGTVATGDGVAAGATGDGVVAGATGDGVVTVVAGATEGSLITGAAIAGAVLVGGPIVAAGIVVGAAFLSGGIERTENAPDPDDPESGHGVGGAPPQNADGSGSNVPLQAPGAGDAAPSDDPDAGATSASDRNKPQRGVKPDLPPPIPGVDYDDDNPATPSCRVSFPNVPLCNGGGFDTPEHAVAQEPDRDQIARYTTDTMQEFANLPDGKNNHRTYYDKDDNKLFSLVKTPCCSDTPAGPVLSWRWSSAN